MTLRKVAAELVVLTIDEGISDYRTRCVALARRHAEERGVSFVSRSYLEGYGFSLDHIYASRPREGPRICQSCCSLRGRVLRRVVEDLGAKKIAVGLNVSDVAEHALTCVLNGEIDSRCLPIHTPTGSDVVFIAPICSLTALECWLYGNLNGIEFLNEDCTYCAEHFHDDLKHALGILEDRNPGVLHSLADGYQKLAIASTSVRTEGPQLEAASFG